MGDTAWAYLHAMLLWRLGAGCVGCPRHRVIDALHIGWHRLATALGCLTVTGPHKMGRSERAHACYPGVVVVRYLRLGCRFVILRYSLRTVDAVLYDKLGVLRSPAVGCTVGVVNLDTGVLPDAIMYAGVF